MKKHLVIVESPSKSKTIEKYLGNDYKVVSSKGHIRDLATTGQYGLGVDIENGFKPNYIPIKGKKKTITELKKDAENSDIVYLASDPDREGEAIAWHLKDALGIKDENYKRVLFNEITHDKVLEAINKPTVIDDNLVKSQETRRILDRIIGFRLSKLLQSKIGAKSAGRVQSVALKLIVDREREIEAFNPEEYWTITSIFNEFEANLFKYKDKDIELKKEADCNKVIDSLSDKYIVESVEKKAKNKKSKFPFITSTLQQEASTKLGFPAKKTMSIAQKLYEGIDLGSEVVGLITYMRTDSIRLSEEFTKPAYKYIIENYGKEYTGYIKKSKKTENVQDAHEAIRPSNVFQTPESIAKYLDKDQLKLYTLIWNRFVASQMTAAVFDTMKVTLSQNGVIFTANGSQIKFDGYMAVYNDSDKNKMLPDMAEGDTVKKVVTTPEQHFTQPPARYSEATLIKTLEENGVGRPSTYAPTLDVIQRRYYVKLVAKRFEPTELGEIVNSLIVEFFPDIVDVKFTAEMEGKLDKVEVGKEQWQKVIDEFFKPFQKELEKAEEGIEKIQIKDEPAGFDCDLCGHPMVIKLGRYGKFYACSNFPDCHNTKAITKEIGVTCPTCGKGQVIERKTKRNRVFYGCDRYPDCEFTSWDIPVGRNCPKSGDYLVEKKVRGGGKQVICSNEECDYKESIVK